MSESAAFYARVSTAQQERERTIASQLEALERAAAAAGLVVPPERRYLDEGFSGARLDRPGLDALRDAAADGFVSQLFVYCPDRLARSYLHQQLVLEELRQRGVTVHFVERPVTERPEDLLLVQMQGVIAEYERAKILERTRRGRLHKVRAGRMLPCSIAPYGYRILRTEEAPWGQFVPEELEAARVREMYRWVLTEELSARQVAKRLNAAGVRPRRARHWVANSVYLILTNPFYSGTACYGRREPAEPKRPRRPGAYRRVAKSSHRIRPRSQWVEVPVPALVTVEEQRRVREQLARNKRRSPRNTRYSYLLRTLVVCGECGWRMQCVRQQSVCKRYQYFYYGCDGRSTVDTGRPERCRAHRVRAERLDAVVWEALASWLENPAMLAREVEAWRAGRSDHRRRDQERGRLEAERRQLERQLERLLDAYQEGAMRIEELKARRARIEQAREQNRLRREEKAAEDQDAARLERISEDLAAFAAALRKGMGELDFAGRQRLVRLLVERVVVTGTDVAIEHVIPLGGRFSGLRPPDGGVLQGAQDRVRL